MNVSVIEVCNHLAVLQDRVQFAAARVRRIRTDAAADPKTFAVPAHVMHSRVALPMEEAFAAAALAEYRDASALFARALAQFPAANDDVGNDVEATYVHACCPPGPAALLRRACQQPFSHSDCSAVKGPMQ